MPQKMIAVGLPRNIARIFVRQLEVLEYLSALTTVSLYTHTHTHRFVSTGRVPRDMNDNFRSYSTDKSLSNTDLGHSLKTQLNAQYTRTQFRVEPHRQYGVLVLGRPISRRCRETSADYFGMHTTHTHTHTHTHTYTLLCVHRTQDCLC
jgi:hypothetical protein